MLTLSGFISSCVIFYLFVLVRESWQSALQRHLRGLVFAADRFLGFLQVLTSYFTKCFNFGFARQKDGQLGPPLYPQLQLNFLLSTAFLVPSI